MKLKTGYLCTLRRYPARCLLAASFVFLLFFKFQLKRFLTQLNVIMFILVEIRHLIKLYLINICIYIYIYMNLASDIYIYIFLV